MKKIITLLMIVTVTAAVAFVSKPNPPSFEEDMNNFMSFATSKLSELSGATTYEDSIAISEQVKKEGDKMWDKWDVQSEFESRWPYPSPCALNCGANYLYCLKEWGDIGGNAYLCMRELNYCIQGCAQQ